jgi:TATA-box binding protein (TBP) (component of TFIID and TFIIIB)
MRDITYHLENAVEYLVYDLSIFPIEERQKKAVLFRSGKCVCNFMGYPPNKIADLRKVGRKVISRLDGKTYAVRVKKKEVTNE